MQKDIWIKGVPANPEEDRLYAVLSQQNGGVAVGNILRGGDCHWQASNIIAYWPMPATMTDMQANSVRRRMYYDFAQYTKIASGVDTLSLDTHKGENEVLVGFVEGESVRLLIDIWDKKFDGRESQSKLGGKGDVVKIVKTDGKHSLAVLPDPKRTFIGNFFLVSACDVEKV